MEDTLKIYKLLISNNLQESLFVSKYGIELFNFLSKQAFEKANGRCAGCGHEPPAHIKETHLYFHIYKINKTNPELSEGVTLCKLCHATQHIENSIKSNLVLFVNSVFDQNQLIRLTRKEQIQGELNQRKIVKLKKSPEKFLEEWHSGEAEFTPTLKVIFTSNFIIDDLY